MVTLTPFIIAVLLLAALFKIAFIFHVLYVLIAVTLLARLWTRYTASHLRFERAFEERALYGDTVTVRITLANDGWVPVPWIRLHDRLPVALAAPATFDRALSLMPREEVSFTYELHCRQRGWYELGPANVETGDVLGMNLVRRDFTTKRRLLVYPRIVDVGALGLPSRTPFGSVRSHHPLYEDPSRVVGVRDYQAGDSLRRINWRASASVGRLQVRKLEPAETLQTIVVLDLNTAGYDQGGAFYATELAIMAAASIASHLVNQRQEVGLVTNGRDPAAETSSARSFVYLPTNKGQAQLTRVLDTLARIEALPSTDLAELLGGAMGELSWGATVVVIGGQETPELTGALGRLRRTGFAVALLLVTQWSPYGNARGGATAMGVPTYYIWRESELEHAGRRVNERRAAAAAG